MKETALVVGATGLVGMELTKQLLDRDEVGLVKVVVRKTFPLEHTKLQVLLLDWNEVDQWGEGNFYFFFQGRDRFDRTSLTDQNRFPTSGS